MTFTDDVLMAYVDRELDAQTRAAIDAALAQDPGLAARLERQRKLRLAVHAAYEPVLAEPMPQRLLDAARGAAAAPASVARRWSWFEWSAMAASVVVGVLAGGVLLNESRRVPPVAETTADFVADRTGMLARGALAHALAEQLASTQAAEAPVRVGLSFVSAAGEYCRTFTLAQDSAAGRLGGLACRTGDEWRVQVVAQDDRRGAATGAYRMAGIEMPSPVLRAVEDRIQGAALDAEAERAAQRRGWVR